MIEIVKSLLCKVNKFHTNTIISQNFVHYIPSLKLTNFW